MSPDKGSTKLTRKSTHFDAMWSGMEAGRHCWIYRMFLFVRFANILLNARTFAEICQSVVESFAQESAKLVSVHSDQSPCCPDCNNADRKLARQQPAEFRDRHRRLTMEGRQSAGGGRRREQPVGEGGCAISETICRSHGGEPRSTCSATRRASRWRHFERLYCR